MNAGCEFPLLKNLEPFRHKFPIIEDDISSAELDELSIYESVIVVPSTENPPEIAIAGEFVYPIILQLEILTEP